MKKRLISLFTSLLMVFSLVAVVPDIESSAEESSADSANQIISEADLSDELAETEENETSGGSKYEFADYVVEVPKDANVHIDENNTVTISNSPVDILNNDTFVVYSGNIPCIYNAESVYTEDGRTVITTSAADKESAVEYMYVDETTDIDLSDFVPAEGFEIVQDPIAPMGVNVSYENSVLVANGNVNICDGVSASVTCKISDLKLDSDYDPNGSEAKVVVKGDVYMNGSVHANFNEFFSGPTKITLGYVNVAGVGNVTLYIEANLEGQITIDWAGNFECGVKMNSSGQISPVNNFNRTDNTVTVEANAQIGITAAFTVDLIFFEGKLSASIGYNGRFVNKTYGDGVSPENCTTLSAYLYANVGASATFKAFNLKKNFRKTYDIYNEKNSPQKIYWHYEDGREVSNCSRGLKIEDQCAWVDSYFTPPRGVDGSGWGGAGTFVPVSIFEYETLEDNDQLIRITGWSGNVSDITIPETIDGLTVVEIGEKAFENNSVIRSLEMADSITEIEGSAFRECPKLERIIISDSVNTIGSEAFEDCSNLSSVKLSKSLVKLDFRAFANCDSLSEIEIPKSLKDTGGADMDGSYYVGPFADCDNLKTVTFEKRTVLIVPWLFEECTGLEDITIPDTVTQIGAGAFVGCSNLKSVEIADTVTEIGGSAFNRCSKLERIIIPDSVNTIGSGAFEDCSSLSFVKLSKSLVKLDFRAFANCDSLSEIELPKSLKDTGKTGIGGPYYVGPFAECDNLKTITFEKGATIIPTGLFHSCTGLEDMLIPDTVTEIGFVAFYGCSNLKSISIPDSVTYMDSKIFMECTSLKSVKLPNGQVNIADATFYNCSSLENITLPNTVENIRESAFSGCKSLKEVKWSKSLKLIDRSAFYGCSSLTDADLPEKVVEIGNSAFENCSLLTRVTMSNSVEKIGSSAFKNCELLESVKLSNKLKTIPSQAFRYCYALTKVQIPNSVTSIESKAFGENTSLKEADFGRNITEIASDAFSYPSKMTFYGYKDTYPQTYADEKGIEFVEKEDEYGDVNGDGEINGKDIIRLRKYLATYDESTGNSDAEVLSGADTNGDGTVNGKDLIRLRKYLADYDEKTGQSSVALGK